MRFYMAAQYWSRPTVEKVAGYVRALGHKVVSTWHVGEAQTDPPPKPKPVAIHDHLQLMSSEVVVVFSNMPEFKPSTGCTNVELGMALGFEKRVLLVGERENMFHHLPMIRRFDTPAKLLVALRDSQSWPTT